MPSHAAPAALAGVRVLDLSRVLAGPSATQLLADFGADVIKIERPVHGDDTRAWAPSFVSSRDGVRHSSYFCSVNRGKRSIAVDIASPAGADVVRRLADVSDVIVENYKVGDLARYGLDPATLTARNPGLIYCSITGFGQTGPYRGRPGYDTIVQALGGLMSITGERDGRDGAGPQRAGLPVVDLMTGVYAALAVTVALRHRDATGEGQHIDLSLLDVQVASMSYFASNYLASGTVPQRTGNTNPVVHPSGAYRSLDGEIVLIVGNDGQFRRFATLVDLPELCRDARFRTSDDRVAQAASLDALIGPALRSRPSAHRVELFAANGIPCGPINDLAQVFDDPQVIAREAVVELTHPTIGPIPVVANPVRLSKTAVRYDHPPPLLGEHSRDILREVLGASAHDIDALMATGAVA